VGFEPTKRLSPSSGFQDRLDSAKLQDFPRSFANQFGRCNQVQVARQARSTPPTTHVRRELIHAGAGVAVPVCLFRRLARLVVFRAVVRPGASSPGRAAAAPVPEWTLARLAAQAPSAVHSARPPPPAPPSALARELVPLLENRPFFMHCKTPRLAAAGSSG
jgi:hypothetical protein